MRQTEFVRVCNLFGPTHFCRDSGNSTLQTPTPHAKDKNQTVVTKFPMIYAIMRCFSAFHSFLFQGICGSTRLALVGGVPYLIPVPNLSKVTS